MKLFLNLEQTKTTGGKEKVKTGYIYIKKARLRSAEPRVKVKRKTKQIHI